MHEALNNGEGKRENCELVRRYGYEVPDYDRATASAKHHSALVAQAEIQPFKLDGARKFNKCHFYTRPVPAALLETHENKFVEIKITLSYFVQPSPGLAVNVEPQRYRSHGLRFDLRRKGETIGVFKEWVNASERDDPRIGPLIEPDDDRWVLGPQRIAAGSLHRDVWTGPVLICSGAIRSVSNQ